MPSGASLKGDTEAIIKEAARRTGLKPDICRALFLGGFMLVDELGQPLRWEKRF
jgi:hypothetical protein